MLPLYVRRSDCCGLSSAALCSGSNNDAAPAAATPNVVVTKSRLVQHERISSFELIVSLLEILSKANGPGVATDSDDERCHELLSEMVIVFPSPTSRQQAHSGLAEPEQQSA